MVVRLRQKLGRGDVLYAIPGSGAMNTKEGEV